MALKPVTARVCGFGKKTDILSIPYRLSRSGLGLLDAPRPLFYFGHEERTITGEENGRSLL